MRRILWFGMGVGSSVWAQRSAKKRLKKYTPPAVIDRAVKRTAGVVRTVQDAVSEGRTVAKDYQDDAKSEMQEQRRRGAYRPASSERRPGM